ncbi:hypothetical protein Hanom_Chr03g00209821 [Helianthus anomalus]
MIFVLTFGLDVMTSGAYNDKSGFLVRPLLTSETRFRGVSSDTQGTPSFMYVRLDGAWISLKLLQSRSLLGSVYCV